MFFGGLNLCFVVVGFGGDCGLNERSAFPCVSFYTDALFYQLKIKLKIIINAPTAVRTIPNILFNAFGSALLAICAPS